MDFIIILSAIIQLAIVIWLIDTLGKTKRYVKDIRDIEQRKERRYLSDQGISDAEQNIP